MTVLKPIRYAENIQGLKKHIDNYVKLDYGTKAVLSYAEKLYDKIKQNELLGEQESEEINMKKCQNLDTKVIGKFKKSSYSDYLISGLNNR